MKIESFSILLLQMEINFAALFSAIRIADEAGVTVVLNPTPAAAAKATAEKFLEKKVKQVVIIMGKPGRAYANDGKSYELLPCIPVDVVDTAGAGDAFNGAFVTALAGGKGPFYAPAFR
jgi:ribokinase